jgi:acetylornithine aminotransferase
MMKKDIIPFYPSGEQVIVKAKDCYLYDSEGKQYIDFEAGVWCANIGHCNEHISKRINDQAQDLVHHGYHFRNEGAEELSSKLQELIGFSGGASTFLSSGSEAVNLAITLARHFTGKKKILKISNSYLSAYGFGQISKENNLLVNVIYNDLNAIDKIDFTEISAFVFEAGGASIEVVRFPEKEFVAKLAKRCVENGCLVIAEEVTTGIGRLGKWFGFQHYNIIPHIVVTGKALGNGFPISSITIDKTLAKQFEQAPFRHAQSHQNDPLGCSIALETIQFIETHKLIEKSTKTGKYFKLCLDELHLNFPLKVKEIRAKGLMLAIEFHESVNGEEINRELFNCGYVLGFKMNTLRFLPPLTISSTNIDRLILKIKSLLQNEI